MGQAELPDISAHPLNVMNTDAIETAAAAVEALGVAVGDNGSQAATAWIPITEAYKGPGDAELLAVMTPVGSMSASVKERTATVAKSLRTFKDTADVIKANMTTLKAELITHTSNVESYVPPAPPASSYSGSWNGYGASSSTASGGSGGSGGGVHGSWDAYGYYDTPATANWRNDSGLIAENERIIKALNDAVEQMHEAERVCMSAIRELNGLTALTAGTGGYDASEYGVDTIPHTAVTPWAIASAMPDDEHCGEAAVGWGLDTLKDLGALGGMAWDEDGNYSHSWAQAGDTWLGMGAMITYNKDTGGWFDWGLAGNTWGGAVADFFGGDRWGENPEGALTDATLNIGTTFLGGAGIIRALLKAGTRGRGGHADADTDVDIDADDFKVDPDDVDVDLELDLGQFDLDLPKDAFDLPDDKPDGPDNSPDTDDFDGPDNGDGQGIPDSGDPDPEQPTDTVPSSQGPDYGDAEVDQALKEATGDDGIPRDPRDNRPLNLERSDGQRGWEMRWNPAEERWVAQNFGNAVDPNVRTWVPDSDPFVPEGRPGGSVAEPVNPTGSSFDQAAHADPSLTKADFGESQAQAYLESQGYTRVDTPKDANAAGIDLIFRHPDGHFVIVEAKYNTSTLGTLVDGTPQMSREWLTDPGFNSRAGDTRIEASVGRDGALLDDIMDAYNAREVTTMVAHVSPDGVVTPRVIDSNGRVQGGAPVLL